MRAGSARAGDGGPVAENGSGTIRASGDARVAENGSGTIRASDSCGETARGVRAGSARVGDGVRVAENGSGTILAVALGLVVMACLAAALTLAQAMAMAHRAASAADLAALAGADAARGLTTGDPCLLASETAAQHGASLTACTVGVGGIVEVRTEPDRGAVFGTATGRARAGPPP
ncbi:Rv3654c family TadE-like protein [Arthrobacter bambusae]|uniref:Secretion/DNA translocation related TadE-like protein n=1 Tax=Arthrobacter bambusae TaxID=1338426 RepID=A0AAW8DBB9_9MICC|nr:Rv3654c family TadE-like protein [Arthrobacter bambusae]MDP9903778.1 secretion/DNA translocation related TadE-like protein [Arthrobacter bambusae]MDQ0128227.1 secretion/DNA translocation related TadE-like protein [Arthrobacter bambusae]MDQ0179569.1 secretion/DNA translocation related TadE-like protein [Arthrobacter bambusae]